MANVTCKHVGIMVGAVLLFLFVRGLFLNSSQSDIPLESVGSFAVQDNGGQELTRMRFVGLVERYTEADVTPRVEELPSEQEIPVTDTENELPTESETEGVTEERTEGEAVKAEVIFMADTTPEMTEFTVESFRILMLQAELKSMEKVCGTCIEEHCIRVCHAHTALLTHLEERATNSDEPELIIVPVDSVAWFKANKNKWTYRQKLRKLVEELNDNMHYTEINGANYVFLCTSFDCLSFVNDLAEALDNGASVLAMYAGITMGNDGLQWPCPLRVIHLTETDVEDAEAVLNKIRDAAARLIQPDQLLTCMEQPDAPFKAFTNVPAVV